jgi:transcription elongation factor S-II
MSNIRSQVQENLALYLQNKVAKKLEKSIYNFTIVKARAEKVERSWDCRIFYMFYKNKALSMIFNLKNGVLKEKIEKNEFEISQIPYFAPWELWPEKYEDYFQKKLKKEMTQLKALAEEQNTVGMYTCGKCKSNCTTFFSLQTRSADEPMTNYITCKKCGNNWKD